MSTARRRRATHAGSWYSSNARDLATSLSSWLAIAGSAAHGASRDASAAPSAAAPNLCALIVPHAGYSYSGPAAAYGYAAVDASKFKRVFILGPSHHVYLRNKCVMSCATTLETPLGELEVDREVINYLITNYPNLFGSMNQDMDEAEHSIEMHLPYVKLVFGNASLKVAPIMVGALNSAAERAVGKALAPWLNDGETLFVISSDFCHWGNRFGYTFVDGQPGEIWQSIERLDRECMHSIESGDHSSYADYLARTKNTVCGRHPIGVLMCAIAILRNERGMKLSTRFVRYEQSSSCKYMTDSSVSYASAWTCFTQE